jgi:hypothetical protein
MKNLQTQDEMTSRDCTALYSIRKGPFWENLFGKFTLLIGLFKVIDTNKPQEVTRGIRKVRSFSTSQKL